MLIWGNDSIVAAQKALRQAGWRISQQGFSKLVRVAGQGVGDSQARKLFRALPTALAAAHPAGKHCTVCFWALEGGTAAAAVGAQLGM